MNRHAPFLIALSLLLSSPAAAQTAVNVRTGAHEGYTRAVFDWPASVTYDVSKNEKGQLVVKFNTAASMTMGSAEHGAGGPLTAIAQTSAAGAPLAVTMDMAPGATYRHFMIGGRVVVDVLGAGAEAATAAKKPQAPPPLPQTQTQTQKKTDEAEKPLAITPAAVTAAPPAKSMPVAPVEKAQTDEPPAAVKSVLETLAPAIDAHVITVSATEAIGLAAFMRGGDLWLVVDRPSLKVPPEIAGSQAGKFAPFQRYELKGGVAYRTRLPDAALGAHLYGEGGGLVWRVVVTPNKREAKPAEMNRTYTQANQVRGGSITWPLTTTTKILEVPDPAVGDVIKVVTVQQSDQFAGAERQLTDMMVLQSVIGLALVPRVDDLQIKTSAAGIEVTRPLGLALSPLKDINRSRIREDVMETSLADAPAEPGKEIRRIFDFDRWMMGGLQALDDNQRILLAGMAPKDNNGRVQDLLTLAKMNVSNDRGQEAVGFLSYAADELPDIADSPEYRALMGASAALAGKYELAFRELFHPSLVAYTELDYWRAFTLAALEDWQQAMQTMPKDFSVLVGYPRPLLEKIGVRLAEVALRSGDVKTSEAIIATLQKERDQLRPWTVAAMDYLKGEAHRQSKEYDEAVKIWEPLSKGADDFYRVRAGVALTMLQLEKGDIKTEQATDRLEGLRYAWRGDELEATVNFMLGRLYLEDRQYLKGFTILRESAGLNPDSDVGRDITAFMQGEFKDLLMNDKDLSPLDAVQVYEEFRELTPPGDDGNRLVQKLAERLVQADLLARAAAILAHQVDYRLQGEEKARVSVRLGAVYLLDKNAREALKYLTSGRDLYAATLTGDAKIAKLKEIDLLRARALSQLNRTEEAIELLNGFDPSPEVNRLRADIAWQSGLWEDAAEALNDLIIDQALDPARPLSEAQADLILNYAVALNLSGNRVALNNTRAKYETGMKDTPRARMFDVVTRPRKTAILADRETIESIVKEVDMFEDFLKTYRTDAAAVSN